MTLETIVNYSFLAVIAGILYLTFKMGVPQAREFQRRTGDTSWLMWLTCLGKFDKA
jgi:hypothetical protein